ncbi:MAG: cysteine synthase family protein [Deltaproteobacteria bacterium]|nr:cysteine synthase family protein [Deltaproteobacteria bacterium]
MSEPSVLDLIGGTPLVPLGRLARGLRVPVVAKCEHLNPGGSVKDRIALAIVDDAEARGVLTPGGTMVEATAGNTGVGLALVAAVRGYKLVCVLPEKMSEEKRQALRSLGAEVRVTPNAPPGHPDHFQTVARRLSEEHGWFLTDQFRNPANPLCHERTTGPELWRQTGGALGAFVAGAGTGGTLTGVGRFLRRVKPTVKIVLADPEGSRLAGLVREGVLGPDGRYLVEGIGSSVVPETLDVSVLTDAETVSDRESFETCHRLVREEGLLVGGSAGTAVAAALRTARRGDLDGPVVVLLPDAWDRYQSRIFNPQWMREVP